MRLLEFFPKTANRFCIVTGKDVTDSSSKPGGTSKESERHNVEIHQATSRTSVFTASTKVCWLIKLFL